MKFLLVSLNAKYSHTSLSVRTLKYYCLAHGSVNPDTAEYTINQPVSEILTSLYMQEADAYFFSCYIWNIEMIKEIAENLSKVRPSAKLFFGGPEATYKAELLMKENSFLTGVIVGEGEETFAQLLDSLEKEEDLTKVRGLMLKEGATGLRRVISLDSLAFNYPDIAEINNRLFYYESSRGCPFSCSYCLSSVENGVRLRSLNLVFADLEKFLEAEPRQVKFVDRTFNCDIKRARDIWQFLMENDNGVTNFHFEMAGDIIDEQSIELLANARKGLFQFEIGVQSVNRETLAEINRVTNLEALAENTKKLREPGNIHLHLDLIAGLPYENYSSFVESFNWVYALSPEQLQLGFLKVLGGSLMEKNTEKYGLIYSAYAPFQVLENKWLSFKELMELADVENMVNKYYNSGRFSNTIKFLVEKFATPFEFYLRLSQHYANEKGEGPLSKIGYYELIGSFCIKEGIPITEESKTLCRYDIMLHEKPKKYPTWAEPEITPEILEKIKKFHLNPENIKKYLESYEEGDFKNVSKTTHHEIFTINPETLKKQLTGILFDYSVRDINGHAKRIIVGNQP